MKSMGVSAAYLDSTEKDPESAWKQLIEDETLETSVATFH